MHRRHFQLQVLAAFAAAHPILARARPGDPNHSLDRYADIEKGSGGRLGVAVMQANGELDGYRLDERFPMCSTFKWLAAACVLSRVDSGQESLDRRIRYDVDVLKPNSPITSIHVGDSGMTLGELCHAAITVSDNAAGNLLLGSFGGPEGLTRYARSLGDVNTRLDRWETELNEATPGDPRDTSTPQAMAGLLRATLVGPALSPTSRAQLDRWLQATQTNSQRLRARLPTGWKMGSKTGTGAHGTTNDVGIFWPPSGAPVLVAVFLTASEASESVRNDTVAQIALEVTSSRQSVAREHTPQGSKQ